MIETGLTRLRLILSNKSRTINKSGRNIYCVKQNIMVMIIIGIG